MRSFQSIDIITRLFCFNTQLKDDTCMCYYVTDVCYICIYVIGCLKINTILTMTEKNKDRVLYLLFTTSEANVCYYSCLILYLNSVS